MTMMSRYKKGCSPSVTDLSVVYTGCDIITCTGATIENGMTLKEIIVLLAQDCYESESVSWGDIIGDIEEQTDLVEFIQSQLPAVSWGNISGDINEQTDLTALIESFVPGWGDLTGDIESQQDLINYLSDNFYDKEVIDNKIDDVSAKSTAEYYRLAEGETTLPPNPEQGGVELTNAWTWLVPGVTYTVNGAPITTPDDRSTRADWDGTTWSLVDMGELPVNPADAEIELGDSRAASGDTIYKALEPVRETIINKNKLDKSLIVAGRRRETDGGLSATDNWISVVIPVKPLTQYTLSGYRGFASTSARVLFYEEGVFDEGATILSLGVGIDTPVTFTTGAAHNSIAVNIANVVGIGLNPTDNEYANQVQLEEGAVATDYAPFGYVVDGDKISGLDDKFASKQTQTTLNSLTVVKTIGGAQLTNKANNRKGQVRTNGTYVGTSDHWCCSAIEPCNPNTQYTSSGHGSASNESMAAVAFYDSSNNFIAGSAVPLSGQDSYTYTSPADAAGRAHTLGNRLDVGLNPSDNELANQFMVNEGNVALPYEPYTGEEPEQVTLLDGDKIANLPITSLSEIILKKITDNLFHIFFHIGGAPDKWFRINLVRSTDLNKFSDVWRLNEGWIVQKVDNGFINVSQVVLNGVYENAIYVTGSGYTDAVGSTHGWEMFTELDVFMDGKKLDFSDPDFTEVKGEYFMFKTLSFFKTADGSGDVATSLKRWEFKNGVFVIKNTIKYIESLTINPNGRSFIGMASIYRTNNDGDLITHSGFSNDDGQTYDISEEGFTTSIFSNQNDPRRNTLVAWGDTFKAELEIKKRTIVLADGTVNLFGLPNAGMYIQNTDRYNKFYSLFGSTTTQPGDMWETEAEYRFSLV